MKDSVTLKKKLRELDPEQKIKVGSNGESSFWYVGTADDMLTNLQVYNAYCSGYIGSARTKAENRLKRSVAAYPTLEEYAKQELKLSKPDLTMDGYTKMVNAWFASLAKLKEAKDQKSEWENGYTNIANREVVEAELCDPASDKGVMRIIIRGHEYGKFWLYSDAKKVPSCSFAREEEEEA